MLRKIIKYLALFFLTVFCLFAIGGLTTYYSTRGNYKVPETIEYDTSLPTLKIGSKQFHGQTFGSDKDPVIIVLHGGPGNDYRMLLPLKELADQYFVVFYDQTGAGLSPRVSADKLTLKNYLQDLDDIIHHFAGSRKAILIGHSWGAMLAAAYISQNPQKVFRAVLAEPGILSNESFKVFSERVMATPSFDFFVHYFTNQIKSFHVKSPDKYAGKDFFYAKALLEYDKPDNPMAGYYCNSQPPRNALPFWRFGGLASESIQQQAFDADGKPQMNLAPNLKKFRETILLLTGECNQIIGTAFQKKYHVQLFYKVKLQEIKSSGHAMFGEQPQASLQAIRRYLQD